MKPKGFLFDVTECALCGACWVADKERNGLPVPPGDFLNDELSARSLPDHQGTAGERRPFLPDDIA